MIIIIIIIITISINMNILITLCDDTDLDSVYRKCCISVDNDQYVTYYGLLETGALPFSFVSRKVAAWIMARRGHELKRNDARQDMGAVHALSLAGTAQSTQVYGCVVFDLTFVNEVTNNPETIFTVNT